MSVCVPVPVRVEVGEGVVVALVLGVGVGDREGVEDLEGVGGIATRVRPASTLPLPPAHAYSRNL